MRGLDTIALLAATATLIAAETSCGAGWATQSSTGLACGMQIALVTAPIVNAAAGTETVTFTVHSTYGDPITGTGSVAVCSFATTSCALGAASTFVPATATVINATHTSYTATVPLNAAGAYFLAPMYTSGSGQVFSTGVNATIKADATTTTPSKTTPPVSTTPVSTPPGATTPLMTTTAPPTEAPAASSSGISSTTILIIGIGISLVFLILLVLVYFKVKKRTNDINSRSGLTDAPPSSQGGEMEMTSVAIASNANKISVDPLSRRATINPSTFSNRASLDATAATDDFGYQRYAGTTPTTAGAKDGLGLFNRPSLAVQQRTRAQPPRTPTTGAPTSFLAPRPLPSTTTTTHNPYKNNVVPPARPTGAYEDDEQSSYIF
ncbi:hypothetical protein SPRG_14659 [Saprolegnia parasitica CBS 223.65]|uniref:Bacterial Ig-like domain-containing protein n=1 Tax=Saprolegnia parasitica (strain CBS 223.65) TaxID=695850 RepID=A0A067BYS0_SAPPC|nr:hypothetical protein SPRG_14659 [Saprolegnia parasitica CBS 223.65]KDO19476.1 hypothetical protein SPRG_14659 [Saprolegnia parasitica CBS 223.65]|eukprot:XP_012209820.1 hypothetical protein SPRG_14659 [Saprolegnia parasitica CBS 223.65]